MDGKCVSSIGGGRGGGLLSMGGIVNILSSLSTCSI